MRTTRGAVLASRTRSSIDTGAGLNSAMIRLRSSASGSPSGAGASPPGSPSRAGSFDPDDGLQHRNDVGGLGHRRGALLDQAVGAFGTRIERRARHGEHFAALLERQPRRDQRARAFRRLDHDDAERKPGDQAIAAGKIARPRLPAERHFGDREAGRQDGLQEVAVLGRIDPILAAGEHGDGAGRQAGAVRGRIDAAGEPGDHGEAGFAQAARQLLGDLDAGGRSIARADDRHRGLRQRRVMAADGKERRRVVDHLQPPRIGALADRNEAHAELGRRRDLALGLLRATRSAPRRRRRGAPGRAARPARRARRRSD